MASLTQAINTSVRRYSIGLEKLHSCNANVETMKEELNDLQPMLKQKTREVQGLLVTLQKDQKGLGFSLQSHHISPPPPPLQMLMPCVKYAHATLTRRP